MDQLFLLSLLNTFELIAAFCVALARKVRIRFYVLLIYNSAVSITIVTIYSLISKLAHYANCL